MNQHTTPPATSNATPRSETAREIDIDQVDLIVTAARQWRILTDRAAAVLGPQLRRSSHIATPDVAGQQILAIVQHPDLYRHRPVLEAIDPIEVMKTCHRIEHLLAGTATYAASPAQQLVTRVLRAASERVPGYAEAPWRWTRDRPLQQGVLIVATTSWGRDLPVAAVTAASVTAPIWRSAALVVVTGLDTLLELTDLPPRDDIVLYLPDAVSLEELWSTNPGGPATPATVVTAPHGTSWLYEKIQQHQRPGQEPA